jgi:hypothetical protein
MYIGLRRRGHVDQPENAFPDVTRVYKTWEKYI